MIRWSNETALAFIKREETNTVLWRRPALKQVMFMENVTMATFLRLKQTRVTPRTRVWAAPHLKWFSLNLPFEISPSMDTLLKLNWYLFFHMWTEVWLSIQTLKSEMSLQYLVTISIHRQLLEINPQSTLLWYAHLNMRITFLIQLTHLIEGCDSDKCTWIRWRGE